MLSVNVQFPSGAVKEIYPIQLSAHVLNAETQAKFGHGLARNAPTLKATRELYEIPASCARTWKQIAPLLRRFKTDLDNHLRANGAIR